MIPRKKNLTTEERALQKLQQLRDRGREMDQAFYKISHDLKSPLNTIVMAATLLEQRLSGSLDMKDASLLEMIRNSAAKADIILQGVSRFRRSSIIDQPEFEKLPIIGLSLPQVLRGQPIHWDQALMNPLDFCFADRKALEEIILEIADNAVRFRAGDHVNITFFSYDKGDTIELVFQSPTVEIPVNRRSELFDLFSMVRMKDADGTDCQGVGLCVAKQKAQALGGSLRFDPLRPDNAFVLSLPTSPQD